MTLRQISHEELRHIAENCNPNVEWYEETDDPFEVGERVYPPIEFWDDIYLKYLPIYRVEIANSIDLNRKYPNLFGWHKTIYDLLTSGI